MGLAVDEDLSASRASSAELPVRESEGKVFVVELQEFSLLRRRKGRV